MQRRSFLLSVAGLPLVGLAAHRARILVIGDSVAWGQGLREPQKMHARLARKLFVSDGLEPSILHYAASGAVIGEATAQPPELEGWWPREAPRDNPTLHQQVAQTLAEHPDRRFDVILITGGINDVNVRTIFSPATRVAEIQRRARLYCRDRMSVLLQSLADPFVAANPRVQILVLGYYPVFSSYSRPIDIVRSLRALAVASISASPAREDSSVRGLAGPLTIRERVVLNSLAFRESSSAELAAAVAIANAQVESKNYRFVDPQITDQEAAFAPNPLIWGLTSAVGREDPVAPDRNLYCGRLLRKRRGLDRFSCERASVGHPNVAGAERYAQKIFEVLRPSIA